MHQIKDLILKTEKVKWQDLKDLQPTNLKTPYHSEATKKSLIKNGFSFPFAVWQDKQGQIFLVDGHLRTDLLRELQNEGVEVPEELTCNYLDLPDRKTAVRHLLEVYNTKKNPIDETAMITWIKDEDLELEDVDIEWVDVQVSEAENEVEELDYSDKNKEIEPDSLGNESNLVFKFDHKTYLNILALLNNAREQTGSDTNEETLLKLLEDYV